MKTKTSPQLVAITGGSGSGKTWLADELHLLLGKITTRLSLDSFYLDRSHLPPARRARLNFDHPRAIDWPRLEGVLSDCKAGRATRLPRYDFTTHTRVSNSEPWQPKPLILMDGLWLLHRPAVRRLFDLSILVDCPARVRLSRRLKRDVAERGRTPAAVRRQFRDTVAPMHRRFVQPQARWADLILRSPCSKTSIHELTDSLWSLFQTGSLLPTWKRGTLRAELARLNLKEMNHEHS